MMKKFLALPALLSFSVACSASPEESQAPATGQARSAIIGGKASTADQDAVVLLIHTDRQTSFASCTGTLIAPNLVLTARHCVSAMSEEGVACKADGTPDSPGAKPGATLRPTEFYVFTGNQRSGKKPNGRGAKVFHDGAKSLCGHDLALVMLDADIPDAHLMPVRLESEPQEGEQITAIGWGVTDSTAYPNKRMQRAGITIQKVGPFDGGKYDSPVPLNDFQVGEGICSGDSGGPGVAEKSGAVVGVVSRGGNGVRAPENNPAAGCKGEGTWNVYTAVAPFKELILQAFEEAGHEPWIEGQPDPRLAKFADPCESGDACRSGVCSAGVCSNTCAAATDCPSGYECGGDKVCKVAAPVNATTTTSSGCVAGATGPVGPVVPWVLAAAAGLLARRRRRAP